MQEPSPENAVEEKKYTDYKHYGPLDVDKLSLKTVRKIHKQNNHAKNRKLRLKPDGEVALARAAGAFIMFLSG